MNVLLDIDGRGVSIDFDALMVLISDDLRERLHAQLAPCSEQTFAESAIAADPNLRTTLYDGRY